MTGAFEIANLFVGMTARDQGLAKTLGQAESRLGKVVSGFKQLPSAAGAAVSAIKAKVDSLVSSIDGISGSVRAVYGAMVGIATGASVAAFGEQEQSIKKLDAALKSTGRGASITREELDGLAASLQQNSNFTQHEITAAEALMLRYKDLGEDVLPRAMQAAVDMGAATGNLEGATEKVAKALAMPLQGLGALDDIGIAFTDTEMEVIKAMWEAGRVADVQAIALERLETAIGGTAKEMADSLSGNLQGAANDFVELTAEVGGFIAEAFNPLVNSIRDAIGWFMDLDDGTKQFLVTTGLLITSLTVFAGLLPLISAGVGTLAAGLGMLMSPVTLIIGGIAGIGAILIQTLGTGQTFAEKMGNAFSSVLEWVQAGIDMVVNWDLTWETVSLAIEEKITHMWERIKWFAENSWIAVSWFFSNFIEIAVNTGKNVVQVFSNVTHNIAQYFENMWTVIFEDMSYSMDTGMRDILASTKALTSSPDFKTFSGTDFSKRWDDNAKRWADRTRKMRDEIGEVGDEVGRLKGAGLDASIAKKEEIKLDITGAADVFKKRLGEVFEETEKNKGLDKIAAGQGAQMKQAADLNRDLIAAVEKQQPGLRIK